MEINKIILLLISMGLIYSNCLDGEVEDCSGECDGYAMVDDCGDCQVAYCYDYITHEVSFELPCEGETVMLVMPNDVSNPFWNENCNYCPNILGDVNSDSSIDVSDLVLMVGFILGNIDEIEECAGDINEDEIINIVDVVQTVQYILGNFSNNATFAEIIVENEKVLYKSDGTVVAFQFNLIHNERIEIEFPNDVLISDYHTKDNITNIIIIMPN